ncbi:hypothetical protein GOBAR_AA07592 [Gossypium barbadense]|uniref:Uncharacterized protein n=1 Tax=Gossypium barbadense TaxID=3634 RepID=A0A2P5YBR9_GOSBA|nr:hypothetical protein GOBAR_AA07592 [Gossypium barbadense]
MNDLILPDERRGGDNVNNNYNTKIVRFKERGEELDSNMVVDPTPVIGHSWKDKLLNGILPRLMTSLGSDILDGDDFEFTEGDVVHFNVNGTPTIDF